MKINEIIYLIKISQERDLNPCDMVCSHTPSLSVILALKKSYLTIQSMSIIIYKLFGND